MPESTEACYYGEEGRERPFPLKIMTALPVVLGLLTSFIFDLLVILFLKRQPKQEPANLDKGKHLKYTEIKEKLSVLFIHRHGDVHKPDTN